jgi:hypothetical protein
VKSPQSQQGENELKVIAAIVLILGCLIFTYFFDASKLTHQVEVMTLADKWHEESCNPMYDGNGNYLGESCSDDWTFVLLEGQGRKTLRVSGQIFREFVPGNILKLEFDQGKLGFHHNENWSKV